MKRKYLAAWVAWELLSLAAFLAAPKIHATKPEPFRVVCPACGADLEVQAPCSATVTIPDHKYPSPLP